MPVILRAFLIFQYKYTLLLRNFKALTNYLFIKTYKFFHFHSNIRSCIIQFIGNFNLQRNIFLNLFTLIFTIISGLII